MNWNYILKTSLIFFFVLDTLGNIPIFISSLKGFDEKKQRAIILREMLIALGIMLLFFFFGKAIWATLNINPSSLNISGGVILFLIGIKLTFATPEKKESAKTAKEPFIVPLAIPALAGPGILATISLYAAQKSTKWELLISILIAWVVSLPILLACSFMRKLFKDFGLVAVERLMGLIVILISVDMFLKGIISVATSAQ